MRSHPMSALTMLSLSIQPEGLGSKAQHIVLRSRWLSFPTTGRQDFGVGKRAQQHWTMSGGADYHTAKHGSSKRSVYLGICIS